MCRCLWHAGHNPFSQPRWQQPVEHAIWDLTYDDLADQLTSPGDSTSYQLSEAINGIAPDITVSLGWETIASDNFESGGWTGGTGWLADWYYEGGASIVTTNSPYEGSYHLQLTDSTGYSGPRPLVGTPVKVHNALSVLMEVTGRQFIPGLTGTMITPTISMT